MRDRGEIAATVATDVTAVAAAVSVTAIVIAGGSATAIRSGRVPNPQ
jgi:hypothetical protein